jgi:putative oxidoreductase
MVFSSQFRFRTNSGTATAITHSTVSTRVNISVAIVTTKIPILLGSGSWLFQLPVLKRYGFWSMAHEARTDFCM